MRVTRELAVQVDPVERVDVDRASGECRRARREDCDQRAAEVRGVETTDDLSERGDRHVLRTMDARRHGDARSRPRAIDDRDGDLERACAHVDGHGAGGTGSGLRAERPDGERCVRHGGEGSDHAAPAIREAGYLGWVTEPLDRRVDTYIAKLPDWQQAICRRVRGLIHEADPEIEETIKRTVQPYFVLNGNVAALLVTKDHVNVFLYDPIAPDPEGIVTAGHENKTGRQIALYRDTRLNERAFVALIRAIAANNRAGGWRRLQEQSR